MSLPAQAAQPTPNHGSRLVPDKPRTGMPRINNGEIFDIEVIPSLNRVFIAGTFTSLQNTTGNNTAVFNQSGLASYNYSTGLIDRTFKPDFAGRGVSAVEATPDGTKLFVGGSFNTVNGVTMQKVASLDLSTGAPRTTFAFTRSTNNAVTALDATNSTVYIGGKFSRVNGETFTGLAAANAATGAIDTTFDNQISGGIGVDGTLTVQQLKLTHDDSKLLVVHTGRQIDGQDRLGMGIIDTATKQLLPWRSRLWDQNLARVGGVTRIYNADIAPDDSYFVVSSGSGGDAPPISDTAIRFPLTPASLTNDDVQPMWIARNFDSVYSVAITESAVYLGGHFQFIESPTSKDPWPGLDNVGYGTGQGLSGYGLGDDVVRRDHLAAVSPATGKALEWNPTDGSNSFEGNKAMIAFPRGLFIGGDGMLQGGVRTGRVGFYDLNQLPAPTNPETTIIAPIEGRVVTSGQQFTITGGATVSAAQGGIRQVQVQVQDRDSKQYLQDDGLTWGASNSIDATLAAGTLSRTWSLPVTVTATRRLLISAKTVATSGAADTTKATKKIESFSFDDQTPATSINGPSGIQTSTTFTMTGTATDDKGVNALTYWFRDDQNRYLQDDGSVDSVFNTFRGTPDVVGAPNATWSYNVTLPHEGVWRGSATAIDTAGQADLRSATRDWTVDSNAVAPSVFVSQPVQMTPPFAVPAVVREPGAPITFSGTATDDTGLKNVEILLRNTTTRENLSADGSWGTTKSLGWYRLGPVDISGSSYSWSYTTPFNLSAGNYQFTVRASDDTDLTTASSNYGSLTLSVQKAGDSPPDGLLTAPCPAAPTPCSTPQSVTDPNLNLTGTATDDNGVQSLGVVVYDNDTGRYLQSTGVLATDYSVLNAALGSPGATSTGWSLSVKLPGAGDYSVTALAYDTSGQQDSSTSGATARYRYYPGDAPPGFDPNLGQPGDNSSFDQGRIVVTGRAVDDLSIAKVEVAVINAAGQYMSSSGTFTSTTPSWRTAFLNSPGSPGSNYSYTTPVIPAGTYTVQVRPTDNHNQVGTARVASNVTVTQPPNAPPVAKATVSCNQNVCTFDGRTSTDENPASLSYSWSYGGTQGTGSGPLPTKTYTAPGSYTVTLTVRDEWGATGTTTLPVSITEPPGNAPPTPVLRYNCLALTCSVSSSGTTDPNTGDAITYTWEWGEGTPTTTTTTTSASHRYAAAGTYQLKLTATDGWGKAASVTQTVTLTEPPGNQPPTPTFTVSCTGRTCQVNSNGTTDPQGDQFTYSWSWGDNTAAATTANPSHTYTAGGTYTITLTVVDGWNKTASTARQVTVP